MKGIKTKHHRWPNNTVDDRRISTQLLIVSQTVASEKKDQPLLISNHKGQGYSPNCLAAMDVLKERQSALKGPAEPSFITGIITFPGTKQEWLDHTTRIDPLEFLL